MTYRQTVSSKLVNRVVCLEAKEPDFPSGVSGELNKALRSVRTAVVDCNGSLVIFPTLKLFPALVQRKANNADSLKHDSNEHSCIDLISMTDV